MAHQFESAASRPTPRPRVSILIVNYNGAKFVRDCLESVRQIHFSSFEVVVVDNASSDGSLEILRQCDWVKTVQSQTNTGFAGGNNLGLRHCAGDYILLLNNDTIVQPGFLEPLCNYLDDNPEVGAVQGKMMLPLHGNSLDVCGSFLTRFGFPYHYGIYKPDGEPYRRNYPVFSGKGACLMFRRETVEKAGGFLFDDHFFCYYEETDFCHRVWLSGSEVHFVSGPPIKHLMGATAGGPQATFVLQHYLRNMAFSLLANLSAISCLRILPFFYAMLLAGLAGSVLTLRSGPAKAHFGALMVIVTQFSRILRRRRLVQTFRRVSDAWIFSKVLRTPRLEYFLKTFRGALHLYRDEKSN